MTDVAELAPEAFVPDEDAGPFMPAAGGLVGIAGDDLADLEAERSLLGALIVNPEIFDAASAEVNADAFFDTLHRRIFTAMTEASKDGYHLGISGVLASLGGDPTAKIFGDMTVGQYVAHIAAASPAGLSGEAAADIAARIHECAECRWREDGDVDYTEPFKTTMGAIWFHEIGRTKPTRNWLLKNLLLAKTFGIAYGPPGCGKSFLITDMALNCAAAPYLREDKRPDWFGYRGRQFGVIYVVAEGRDDFEIRLHAWRMHHCVPDDVVVPFVFLPTTIDMRSGEADTARLAKEAQAISDEMHRSCGVRAELIVIDTVARALAGGNENASEVMSAFVRNCGKLQEHIGASVLGVHHGGKEGGRGPRGHEALHGAADFEIEVVGQTEDGPNLWIVRKLKSGPGGATHRFRLRSVTVGVDVDRDNITSCIVSEIPRTRDEQDQQAGKGEGAPAPIGFRLSNQEAMFFGCLLDALASEGVVPPSEVQAPRSVPTVVDYEYVKARVARKMLREEDSTEDGQKRHRERVKTALKRARENLTRSRIVGCDAPFIWWTGKPVRGFTRTPPALSPANPDPITAPGEKPDDIASLV